MITKLLFLLSESLRTLFRAKLPAAISSITIGIALIIFSLVYFTYENLLGYSHQFKSRYRIEVFFYDNLDFELESGQIQTSSLSIANSGEAGSELNYSVSMSYPSMESPFDVSGGGPDAYGFYWTDSNISSDLSYNWIDISSDMNQVTFETNDVGTELIEIGFTPI